MLMLLLEKMQGRKFTYFLGGNFCPHLLKSRGICQKIGGTFINLSHNISHLFKIINTYLCLQYMSNCHQMAIIRLLGSSLQIQSVFLDFLNKNQTENIKSDNHIQFYSYFF